MKDLFTYLCNFSIVTSIAIVLAVLLRPVLKKGPSYIRCILWALVFLRLLVPVGFAELPFSAPTLFDTAEEHASVSQGETNVAEKLPAESLPAGNLAADNDTVRDPVQTPGVQVPDTQTPADQAPDVQVPDMQTPNVQAPNVQAPVNDAISGSGEIATPPVQEQTAPLTEKKIDGLLVVSAVWAVGVVAMLGYMLVSNLLLRYRVRGAIVYDSRIRVIDKDCSPFVFGFFRPIIYIPASAKQTDWSHIVAHESSHIKRFDHVLKPLAFFVLCFYWFNPLVWVAYALLSKDIEYACDERTVKHMESNDRKAYSLALLSVSQGENIVFAPPLSFGKVNVKERIKRVMNRKIPVWAMCLTIIICASLLILVTLTPAAVDSLDADSSSEQSSADMPPSERSASILYEPGASLPSYWATVAYTDTSKQIAEELIITEKESGKELQRIKLPDNWRFTEEAAFALDVTFDGYVDLLLPNQRPSGAVWYHAFVWDAEAGELVYTPGFSELSNVALDAERKQILSHRTSSMITAYSISAFDADKKDFILQHSLYWDWSNDAATVFKEYNEKDEIVNQFIFSGTTLSPVSPNAKPYFEEGSVWELASSKWETLLLSPSENAPGKNRTITIYYPDDDWEGYIPFTYEMELSAENLIALCKQHGLLPKEAELLSFEIKNGVGLLDMNAECYAYSDTYHETIGLRAVEKTFLENYKDQIDRVRVTYDGETPGDPFRGDESGTGEDPVRFDENGNVILSDPPTYAEILALHMQNPEVYRDPGELQPETHEMIRLENGQWYQSYVAGSYNCRFILLSWEELGQGRGFGDFRPIGSAENAFLYNLDVMYDNPKGDTLYGEGSHIAVRGTLSQAPDGYAYQLQLPDELIVCAGLPDGTAALLETETLAIPEAYASLFEGKTGEVVVTGVVMQDKNGVFYLKDVALYL